MSLSPSDRAFAGYPLLSVKWYSAPGLPPIFWEIPYSDVPRWNEEKTYRPTENSHRSSSEIKIKPPADDASPRYCTASCHKYHSFHNNTCEVLPPTVPSHLRSHSRRSAWIHCHGSTTAPDPVPPSECTVSPLPQMCPAHRPAPADKDSLPVPVTRNLSPPPPAECCSTYTESAYAPAP